MSKLEQLSPQTWEEFTRAPLAVMMLGKGDCEACKAWTAELEAFLASGAAPAGARFGKLLLDQPGLISFKRANPWIAELDVLPTNVIWSKGERVKTWSGGGVERLTNRLERLQEAAAG
jgi:hypothetical protein